MPKKAKPKEYFQFWGGKIEFPEGLTLPTSKEPMTPETWATYIKNIKQLYAEPRMEGCRREFEKSGNPLFAWCALEIWLAFGHHCKIDMPSWMRNHFWKTSASLLADGVVQADVPGILGLEGKHYFTDYRRFIRDAKLALRVAVLLESGQAKRVYGKDGAIKLVAAESGETERVVTDAYKEFNKQE